MPRLNGSRSTCAPASSATAAVRSTEPSSTTTTSSPGSKARISAITRPTFPASLKAGTIAIRFMPKSFALTEGGATSASSATANRRLTKLDELEQPPGARDIGVLVQRTLPRAPRELLGGGRILEQVTVRLDRPGRVLDDEELLARLEPALDSGDRVRDDRSARHRELERPGGRRRVHCCVAPARDVQAVTAARGRTG